MNAMTRMWRTWRHGRKFAALGRHCRFPEPQLYVEGHVTLGDDCRFRNNVTLRTVGEGRIRFGNRSGCSWGVTVASAASIEVGDYSGMAEFCYVCDYAPVLAGNAVSPAEAARTARPIRIGQGCFIGCRCYIGPGVTIGDGAVVGNHSVVLTDVGPGEIWVGAPARRIGHRTDNIPEARRREYEELVARYGIQSDRYQR